MEKFEGEKAELSRTKTEQLVPVDVSTVRMKSYSKDTLTQLKQTMEQQSIKEGAERRLGRQLERLETNGRICQVSCVT